MSQKILVTYASRSGSTAGIAEAIGRTLAENGVAVDVLPMNEVQDIAPYRAVVAGSAIQKEKWLPEAMEFMNKHQAEIAQKPFAAFLVCMALALNNSRMRERAKGTAATWMEPIRTLANPVSEGLFAGVLDLSKLPALGYKVLGRLGILIGLWKQGDHRDWDAIHGWANDLPAKLLS